MYYITVPQPEKWKQVTLEEFLFGNVSTQQLVGKNNTGTITYERLAIWPKLKSVVDVDQLINKLKVFNETTEPLRHVPRESLYREFKIPKKSGGWRKIDAPNDMLKGALRTLKDMIYEEFWGSLYHTSAFAYIKGRSVMDAMERHQANNSKWFAKYDFTNFFGSVTIDFTMDMLSKIFPFCLICEDDVGREELYKAIELGFLNGGLPQGTPLSPALTNIIMIPIDFNLNKRVRNYLNNCCITRYADDFQISSKYKFDYRKVEQIIVQTLADFNAPMKIKPEKTRFGSSSGRNWNLGLMLNRDNNITVGYRKKKQYQTMLFNFIKDTLAGNHWEKTDIMVLNGYMNYYKQIEGGTIDRITYHVGKKLNCDPFALIKIELNQ